MAIVDRALSASPAGGRLPLRVTLRRRRRHTITAATAGAARRVVAGAAALACSAAVAAAGVPGPSHTPAAGRTAPAQVRFLDRSARSGLVHVTWSGGPDKNHILESAGNGVLVLDYDGDDWPDLLLPSAYRFTPEGGVERHPTRLYRNRRDGTFTEVTRPAAVELAAFAAGGCVGDYDGDGFDDLYVTALGEDALLRNLGDGTFERVSGNAGIHAPGWSTGATFFDADGDGDLDLFVAAYVRTSMQEALAATRHRMWRGRVAVLDGPRGLPGDANRFFRNRGDGTFVEATAEAGLDAGADAYSFGVVAFDADGDGDRDLYVANDSQGNALYVNDGTGHFVERGMASGLGYNANGMEQGSMGVDVGDYDRDGRPDVVVTNFALDGYTLYRNAGGGLFLDVSFETGIAVPTYTPLGWGAFFFDADLDGDEDLFFANGHLYAQVDEAPDLGESYRQRNQLLLNEDGRFAPVANGGDGLAVAASSRGAAWLDYDRDGDLDVVVSNQDAPPTLLENATDTAGNWIAFELVDPAGERGGHGARVRIEGQWDGAAAATSGVSRPSPPLWRSRRSGGSYLSEQEPRLHFGTGAARRVRASVLWPDGTTEPLGELTTGRAYRVRRGAGALPLLSARTAATVAPRSRPATAGRAPAAAAKSAAVAAVRGALPLSPQAGDDRLQRARRAFAAGDHETARALLQELLGQEPERPETHLLLGRVLFELGALDEAEQHLRAALDGQTRQRFMAPHTLGQLYLLERRYTEAVAMFDRALERAPHFSGSLFGRAQARAFLGDLAAAFADLDTAAAGARPQPAAALLAGELELAQGHLREGLERLAEVARMQEPGVAVENAGLYVSTLAQTPAESIRRVHAWLRRTPNRAAPYFWWALIAEAAGAPARARALLRLALAVDDGHVASWLALRRLDPAFDAAAATDPATALAGVAGPPLPGLEVRMARARAQRDAGRLAEAEEILVGLLQRREAFVPARLLLLEIARARHDPLGRLAQLEWLAGALPELSELHAERAAVARDVGALELAERAARQALAATPEQGALHYLLATVLQAAGRPAEALAACEAALAYGYETAPLQVLRGNLRRELQDIPGAVAALRRAVQLDATAAEQVATFALEAMVTDPDGELRAMLEQYVAEHPESRNARYALGTLLLRAGAPARAVELLEPLLRAGGGDAQLHYNLALAYRRLGRDADADEHTRRFEQLKAAEAERFERANALYRATRAARAALAAGDATAARGALEPLLEPLLESTSDEALAVNPAPDAGVGARLPAASVAEAFTLLARARQASGDLAGAAAAAAQALARRPFDRETLCAAAAIAADAGEVDRVLLLRERARLLGTGCE